MSAADKALYELEGANQLYQPRMGWRWSFYSLDENVLGLYAEKWPDIDGKHKLPVGLGYLLFKAPKFVRLPSYIGAARFALTSLSKARWSASKASAELMAVSITCPGEHSPNIEYIVVCHDIRFFRLIDKSASKG